VSYPRDLGRVACSTVEDVARQWSEIKQ